MAVRLAFASDDGTFVDNHFGHARYYTILELDEKNYKEVDSRVIPSDFISLGCGECGGQSSQTDLKEVSMEEKFGKTLELLSDCAAIFVYRIGQGAAHFMLKNGLRVFRVYGPIEEIMEHVIKNNLLEGG